MRFNIIFKALFHRNNNLHFSVFNIISRTCAGSFLLPLPGSSQDPSYVCGTERAIALWTGRERRRAAPRLTCLWPPLLPPPLAAPPQNSRPRSWDARRWLCRLWRSRRQTPHSCCHLPLLPPAPEQKTTVSKQSFCSDR